jgi:hypothetical protein
VEERAVRKFSSVDDLKLRIPAIQKSELAGLAEIGALNFIAAEKSGMHRRDALWQVERAARRAGALFEGLPEFYPPTESSQAAHPSSLMDAASEKRRAQQRWALAERRSALQDSVAREAHPFTAMYAPPAEQPSTLKGMKLSSRGQGHTFLCPPPTDREPQLSSDPEGVEPTGRPLQAREMQNTPTVSSTHGPLAAMTSEERLVADFRGTGMTIGPHPMAYKRAQLKQAKVRSVAELGHLPNGMNVRIAGAVIARQRPGTANGFVFLSLEDETGITNAIITPELFKEAHATVVQQQFLLIEGKLQNQEGVISVKAESVQPLTITQAETSSHDFH